METPDELAAAVLARFAASGKRHLFLTGPKGSGKTTLCRELAARLGCRCGLVSEAVRPSRGVRPERVVVRSLARPGRAVTIGLPDAGGAGMAPCPEGFDAAARLLEALPPGPDGWVLIDEVGYLEEGQPRYRAALLACLERARVLAALRKDRTPLLDALARRGDALLVDLDEL